MKNKKNLWTAGALVAAAMLGLTALPAFGQQKENEKDEMPEQGAWKKPPTPSAKISPIQAMAKAKAKLGGTPFGANFEYDEGQWVYGVMIVKGHTLYEVEVDPKTGKVLDSETVDPADEAMEMKADLAKVAAAGG